MQETNILIQLLPLILIFVVFYFLLIRPQQKAAKERAAMLEAIRRGDKVVTGGGFIGLVTRVGKDDELTIEIADGVRVKALRSTISTVLAKTEPAKSKKDEDDDEDDEDDEE
ncbi:MAG: preprotein translocase subunit YajC [Pseudomonadota bacterium]